MRAWLNERVARSQQTLALAVGDATMIVLFVALGELHHGRPLGAGWETVVQFWIGWLLVAVPAGVYAAGVLASTPRAAFHGVAAWMVAALVGQLIRLLMTPGAGIEPPFVLVSVAVGSLLVGAWRFAAASAVS